MKILKKLCSLACEKFMCTHQMKHTKWALLFPSEWCLSTFFTACVNYEKYTIARAVFIPIRSRSFQQHLKIYNEKIEFITENPLAFPYDWTNSICKLIKSIDSKPWICFVLMNRIFTKTLFNVRWIKLFYLEWDEHFITLYGINFVWLSWSHRPK